MCAGEVYVYNQALANYNDQAINFYPVRDREWVTPFPLLTPLLEGLNILPMHPMSIFLRQLLKTLATGTAHEANIWSQDADFKGLPHVKYIKK